MNAFTHRTFAPVIYRTIGIVFMLVAAAASGCQRQPVVSPDQDASEPLPVSNNKKDIAAATSGPVEIPDMSPPDVLYTGQDHPVTVEVHGDYLYWVNAGTNDTSRLQRNKGSIMRGPKQGGKTTLLFDKQNLPNCLALDLINNNLVNNQLLFWTTEYDVISGPAGGGKSKLLFNGSSEQGSPAVLQIQHGKLAMGFIHPLHGSIRVVNSTTGALIKQLSVVGGVSALAITAEYVFAYSHNQHTIGKIALHHDDTRIVQSNVFSCSTMAADDNHVFWAEPANGRIMAMTIDTAQSRVISLGYDRVWDLVLDGQRIWVTDRKAGTITFVPTSGGRGQIVAKNQENPHSLTVDNDYVYWVEPDKGTISRVKKP